MSDVEMYTVIVSIALIVMLVIQINLAVRVSQLRDHMRQLVDLKIQETYQAIEVRARSVESQLFDQEKF